MNDLRARLELVLVEIEELVNALPGGQDKVEHCREFERAKSTLRWLLAVRQQGHATSEEHDVAELSRLLQLTSPAVRKRALELLPGDVLLELARRRGLV